MSYQPSPSNPISAHNSHSTSRLPKFIKLIFASAMCVLLLSSALLAQTSTVSPRVTTRVDDRKRVTLDGNVPLQTRTRPDLGEASSSTELTHIRLVLARSPEQQAALDQYLVDLQSKSSPNYHRWLTPEQFGKLYGPADSDVAAIVAWVESHGLKLEQVSVGRTNIAVSGTVGQVEEAFRVQIHSYAGKNGSFFSNTTDPSIPAALASVVKGVAHLNTIMPTPDNIPSRPGMYDSASKKFMPASNLTVNGVRPVRGAHPELTLGSGTADDPYFLYIVAGDAATIYNEPNSLNANFSSGTSYDGTGVTIGIGGVSEISPSTVADYRTAFLGDSNQPTYSPVGTVTVNGAQDEAYIDTELSGALAPGATIDYYPSNDLVSGIEQALTDNKVDIFSLSFGECELDMGTSGNQELYGYWEQAAGQGIAVTVSSGDSGAAACDANTDSNGDNVPDAVQGLQVSGFASTPYNIAVGGTDLYGLNSSFATYVSTANSTSASHFRSALKYIPESTWNDSSLTDTTISANVPVTGTDQNGNPLANIVGGGGGKSACSVNTTSNTVGTCTSGYSKPYWQRGAGVPSDSARDLPDVSLMAGNGYDPATWLICTDDQGTNSVGDTITANCTTQTDGNFYFFGFGGTSTSAPAFAGILATVQQKTGGRLGQAAIELYDLYNSSHASSIFHDTTTGNISEPCTSGTPNCSQNAAGYYYLTGYDTTTGYDLATGLGSVDATQLVAYYGTANGAQTATVSVTPSAATITETQALTVSVSLAGTMAAGSPTGTVTLTSGSYTSSPATLSAGSSDTATASFTIPAGKLAVGSDSLKVTYSGDLSYAIATGSATVDVTGPVASVSPSSLTFASTTVGSSAATQAITVSNVGSSALTVSSVAVSGTNASSFTETNNCSSVAAASSCSITVTFTPTAAGTLKATITITDNSATATQSVALTGTGAAIVPPSFALAAPALTVNAGSSGSESVTVTPAGGYTGTVNLTCSITSSPAGAVDSPTCAGGSAAVSSSGGTGTLTITTTGPSSSAVRSTKIAGLDKHNSTGFTAGRWAKAGVGTGAIVIAGLLFFGIPARRRSWQSILGILIVIAGFGVLSGCGGSGGSKTTNPGTTAGNYTITVTGVDSVSSSITSTQTFTLTVN